MFVFLTTIAHRIKGAASSQRRSVCVLFARWSDLAARVAKPASSAFSGGHWPKSKGTAPRRASVIYATTVLILMRPEQLRSLSTWRFYIVMHKD